MLTLWLATALAAPVCDDLAPIQRDEVSVAWVSRVGARASGRSWLTVVNTADLRGWATSHHADLTRLLQGLGRRRSDEPPRHGWKVVVFDVDADTLCRPTDTATPGSDLAGVAVCEDRGRHVSGIDHGCGHTVDRLDGGRGLDVFHVRWDDAARQGFCVLPVDRFLDGR